MFALSPIVPQQCLPTVRWREKHASVWSMQGYLNITYTAFQCVLVYLTRCFLAVVHFSWIVHRVPPSENTQGSLSAESFVFKCSSNYYFSYAVDNTMSVHGTAQTPAIQMLPCPPQLPEETMCLRTRSESFFGPLTSMGTQTIKLKQMERNCAAESPISWLHHLYFSSSSISNNRSCLSKASLCSAHPGCCLKWDLENTTFREKQV